MKTRCFLISALMIAAIFVSCSSEEEVDINGEYVIYIEGEDVYNLRNQTVEIYQEGNSYRVKTEAIGDELGVQADLETNEMPNIARFMYLDLVVTWLLTPEDDGFNVIWRDSTTVDDVEFELRRLTDAEKERIAREEQADSSEASTKKKDPAEFLVTSNGELDISVQDLVFKIHGASDDEFAGFADTYKLKSASASVKIESVNEVLGYEKLYKIIAYRDFDSNSWNKNTLRLTLYTTNRDVALSYKKNETHELAFTIIKYENDEVFYVIAIDGTLVTE